MDFGRNESEIENEKSDRKIVCHDLSITRSAKREKEIIRRRQDSHDRQVLMCISNEVSFDENIY